jgi:hypothetical protein
VLTTFSMTGPGWGQVLGASSFTGVEVRDSTATSVVRIVTPAGRATAVGGILLKGDLGELNAPAVALRGDLTAELSLRKLTLGDVSGGHLLAVNTLGTYPPGDHTTAMAFARVGEASIDTHGIAITSLSAVEWLDADGTADRIVAPWLGKLTVTGRAANVRAGVAASAGDFQADLVLDGTAMPARKIALGGVRIAGALSGSAWAVQGDAGPVAIAGAVDNWAADMGKLASLTAGAIGHADLTARDALGIVKALRWGSGRLTADSIATLTITGRGGAQPVAGDYAAALVVTGLHVPAGRAAFGSATIAGNLSASIWDITGDLSRLTVTGRSVGSTVRTTGGMAALTFGATDTSHFLAGIVPGVTDHARLVGDFKNPKATIGSITVRGRRLPSKSDPTDFVIDTQFSAATMGAVSLINTNSGATCGLYVLSAAGKEIRSLRYVDTLTGESYTWSSAKGAWAHFSSLNIEAISV